MPSHPSPAVPAHPWAALFLLCAAIFAVITTEVVPIGILPRVVGEFGLDESAGGLLVSLYAALVAVTAVPLTRLTARLPRKPVLLATLVVFTLSNAVAALAGSFAWLVVARAVGGMAHALFFALAIGYATRIAPPGSVGKALALTTMGGSAGFILGVPAGTALAEALSWRWTFGALALLTGAAFVVALVLLPAVEHSVEASRVLVPGGGTLLLVAGLAGAAFLGHYTLYTYVSPLLLSAGLDASWLSVTLVVFGVAGLVAIRLVSGRLDRRPVRWLFVVPAAVGAGLLLMGVAATGSWLWGLLVIGALWVAAFAPINSVFQNMLVRVGRENPEMSGAWINVMCNIGIGGGSALGGVALGLGGYPLAAWVGCGVLVVALGVTWAGRARLRAVSGD